MSHRGVLGSPCLLLTGLAITALTAPATAQLIGGEQKVHIVMPTSGVSGAWIGDLDRDGVPDYAIGTSLRYSPSTVDIISGRTNRRIRQFSRFGTRFGASVAGVGDANGDGYPDVLIGAPEHDSPLGTRATGAVFLYSGLDGRILREWFGQNTWDYFGSSVSYPGDLDDDGVGDYLVSNPQADPGGVVDAGSVFIFSGAGGILHAFHGAGRNALLSGGVARDIDRDGIQDLVLTHNTAGGIPGSTRVVSGRTFDDIWRNTGIRAGIGVGDIDGDGVPDLATGNSRAGTFNQGEVWVFSGVDGSVIHHILGRTSQYLGTVVGPTGDVNGDGHLDFGVGEGNLSVGGFRVFSGRDASQLLYRPVPVESISPAADLDGDGFRDVLASAYFSTSYVIGIDPYMAASTPTVSASTGGTIRYTIDFPDAADGDNYLVLMSASGTGPFTFGVAIPLTPDGLMVASLQNVLAPLQNGFFGTLSNTGTASASLLVPPGLFAPLAGLDLNLAAVAFAGNGRPTFSSVANRLTIRP